MPTVGRKQRVSDPELGKAIQFKISYNFARLFLHTLNFCAYCVKSILSYTVKNFIHFKKKKQW
ncbi:MAG: hypothetical protein D3904_16875 [Candidatus Electrothrix sp. EH2]|nr:hypothetical protein [Candidatus Electrothrix sp. EH2]